MNIKSLLIGSAAALAAVSGAQAADAIIAAEPEPVEYVRVCDAFGAGYFYIPGTETCLKISGYVRVQASFGRGTSQYSDYDIFARGRLNIEAKNDTELGTLSSYVRLFGRASENYGGGYDNSGVELELAYIDLAGFRVGKFYSIWDDGIAGETDSMGGLSTLFASVRYEYVADGFRAGLSIDELTSNVPGYKDANVGIAPYLTASFGGIGFKLYGGYDVDAEEGAVTAVLSANIGPGKLDVAGIYSSGYNTYYHQAEWSLAAAYAFKATDKLTITPGAQYWNDVGFVDGIDRWKVGLTAEYKIVSGLTALATINYQDQDRADDQVLGFLRLQRDF